MVVVGPSEAWVLQVISITFQVHKGKSQLGLGVHNWIKTKENLSASEDWEWLGCG